MALPGEVDDLKSNLIFFGSSCLVHFWSPFGSLCQFKALIGPCLGSLEPHNFVREVWMGDLRVDRFFFFVTFVYRFRSKDLRGIYINKIVLMFMEIDPPFALFQ